MGCDSKADIPLPDPFGCNGWFDQDLPFVCRPMKQALCRLCVSTKRETAMRNNRCPIMISVMLPGAPPT